MGAKYYTIMTIWTTQWAISSCRGIHGFFVALNSFPAWAELELIRQKEVTAEYSEGGERSQLLQDIFVAQLDAFKSS